MLCHKFLGLLESRSARRLLFSCPARRHLGVRVCPAPILLRARCGGLWCGLAKPRPGASREGGGESACVCTCVRRGCRETCMPLAAGWSWLPRVDSVHDFPCFRRKESGLGWCRVESLRQSGVESSYTVGRQAGRRAGAARREGQPGEHASVAQARSMPLAVTHCSRFGGVAEREKEGRRRKACRERGTEAPDVVGIWALAFRQPTLRGELSSGLVLAPPQQNQKVPRGKRVQVAAGGRRARVGRSTWAAIGIGM